MDNVKTYPRATTFSVVLTDGSRVYNVSVCESADTFPVAIKMDSRETAEQLIDFLEKHSNLLTKA